MPSMKAIILVGGLGTRLRPLTLNRPKPLVEFCNKPMVMHQITELVRVGVNHVILAVSYKAEMMNEFVEDQEKKLGIKITLSHEEYPMGTAGPLALAKKYLLDSNNNQCNGDEDVLDDGIPFFVLNSDIVCNYPFQQMIEFHKSHKAEGTIAVTTVENPDRYGVVVYEEGTGLVERFVEKPKEFVSNRINAGLYIFNKTILNRIGLKPTSIERETFPEMASAKQLYKIDLEGYWMDVGQPRDYLRGMNLFLNWLKETQYQCLAKGDNIIGNVLIDPKASIGENCIIGPDVSIGPGVIIEDNVSITGCTLLAGCRIEANSKLSGSIIGWNCSIGKGVTMENLCVLGEEIRIEDETHLDGAILPPIDNHNSSDNQHQKLSAAPNGKV